MPLHRLWLSRSGNFQVPRHRREHHAHLPTANDVGKLHFVPRRQAIARARLSLESTREILATDGLSTFNTRPPPSTRKRRRAFNSRSSQTRARRSRLSVSPGIPRERVPPRECRAPPHSTSSSSSPVRRSRDASGVGAPSVGALSPRVSRLAAREPRPRSRSIIAHDNELIGRREIRRRRALRCGRARLSGMRVRETRLNDGFDTSEREIARSGWIGGERQMTSSAVDGRREEKRCWTSRDCRAMI